MQQCVPLVVMYICIVTNIQLLLITIIPVGTDTPTIKLLNNHVRDDVAPRWYDLGIQLLNEKQIAQLKIIKDNHPQDVVKCCTEMFDYWLRVDVEASWNKLIAALKMIDEISLAQKIKTDVLRGL